MMQSHRGKFYSYNFFLRLFWCSWLLLAVRKSTQTPEKTFSQDYSNNGNASIIFASGFVIQPTTRSTGPSAGFKFPSASFIKNQDVMPTTSLSTVDSRLSKKILLSSSDDDRSNSKNSDNNKLHLMKKNRKRSILFSILMSVCGAGLGPFLDSYHSAFGVLKYDSPIQLTLWGSETYPALTTTWWVPQLFGFAGFLIGWLYILLDHSFLNSSDERRRPSPPKILIGISFFTLQYWLSGMFVQTGLLDRSGILSFMSILAAVGFLALDGTFSGLIVSLATCLGGPLIEALLITATTNGVLSSGYHYTDLGETGFFPLWIVPVYFLGGPANGNLARWFWNLLSIDEEETITKNDAGKKSCKDCLDTRRIECPTCDGIGTYVATGNRTVKCTSCNARGFVMCRSCFNLYDDDPYDVDGIKEIMNRMPD